jgi:hypothetical protein
LLESRFNLLGPYNDGATGASAARTHQVSLAEREQTDLVVFLESLGTFSNPYRPDEGRRAVRLTD